METGSRQKSVKTRIFEIIQIAGGSDWLSRVFDRMIILLIILSIVITTAQTFSLPDGVQLLLDAMDAVCMVIFTAEYLLRFWTAGLLYPEERHPHLRYVLSTTALIDLLSFLPFYLGGIIPPGLIVFRLIRVARILRIFRINRYSDPLMVITSVLKRKASQIFASIFLVFLLMLASSLIMYYAEHEAQPDTFRNAFSGLWWAVSTLSTTGYGDIYPVTFLGKALAIVITLLGMSVVAIPTGIITAGFMETAGNTAIEGAPEEGPAARRVIDITGARTAVDAPARVLRDGNTIDQITLDRCVGRCICVTMKGTVTPEKLGNVVMAASAQASNRVILRGDCTVPPETARYINELGIMMVGIEEDGFRDPEVTRELLGRNVVIVRGLELGTVEDGEYMVSAAPVKKEGAGSAPCRAFLAR